MSGPFNEPRIVEVDEVTTASIRDTVAMADIRNFFDGSIGTLGTVLADQSVTPTGAPFGLYRGQPTDTVDIEVGFPTDRPIDPDRGVSAGTLPAGRVARMIHQGSFDTLGDSWQRLMGWIIGQGELPGPMFWEVYLTEPTPDMDPAALSTALNCLLAS